MDWFFTIMATPVLGVAAAIIVVLFAGSTLVIAARIRSAPVSLLFVLTNCCACLSVLVFLMPPMVRDATGQPLIISNAIDLTTLDEHAGDVFVLPQALPPSGDSGLAGMLAQRTPGARTVLTSDLQEVAAWTNARSLRLAGYGVAAKDWFELRADLNVDGFAPMPLIPPGFVRIDSARTFAPGAPVLVDVVVTAPSADCQVQARNALEEVVAQQSLPADGKLALRIPPQAPGRHVLELSARCGDDAPFAREPLAFDVRPPALARVLMLRSAPSFEARFLLRWLERAGASVAMRTQISDARFAERFVGRESFPIDTLTVDVLQQVDIVIIDGQALSLLQPAELAALLAPDTGHGVLVTLGNAQDAEAAQQLLAVPVAPQSTSSVTYQTANSAGRSVPLLTRLDVQLDAGSMTGLLAASDDAPIAARLRDRPFVGVSLIADSYRWGLSGDAAAYAELWSQLVASMARTLSDTAPQIGADIVQVGTRTRVCVPQNSGSADIAITESDGGVFNIALHAGALLPGQRCGWFWPQRAGWLRASAQGQNTDVYVYAPQARQVVRAQRARTATQQMIASSARGRINDQTPAPSTISRAAVPRRWSLFAVLISLLASWALQRLGLAQRQH